MATPVTTKAAPMSRTKWGLNGPVSGTPGTMAYHWAGSASMRTPLAASSSPSPIARATRMAVSCRYQQDETARACVTWRAEFLWSLRGPRRATSGVKFRVVTENTLLVERNAPFRGEIGRDARTLADPLGQHDKSGDLSLEPLHAVGESVAQARHDLEQREVDIAQPPAEHIVAAVSLQHPLEIAEIFLRPSLPEFRGVALRLLALVFIVERRPNRVVGVVNLFHKVRDR